MTELETCYAIKRFLSEHLKEMRLPVPSGESAINFYMMSLPQPKAQMVTPRPEDDYGNELGFEQTDDDDTPIFEGGYTVREAREVFPAIIITPVKSSGGTDEDLWGTATILLTFGVFEESNECIAGPEWLANLATRTRQLFERYRVLEDRCKVALPLSWELMRESVRPFWFAEMPTEWRIPLMYEEIDLLHDYRGANYPSGNGPYPNQPKKG